MKIYVNDGGRPTITAPQREPLVGRDLYLFRQMHGHDGQQEPRQKKVEVTPGRDAYIYRQQHIHD